MLKLKYSHPKVTNSSIKVLLFYLHIRVRIQALYNFLDQNQLLCSLQMWTDNRIKWLIIDQLKAVTLDLLLPPKKRQKGFFQLFNKQKLLWTKRSNRIRRAMSLQLNIWRKRVNALLAKMIKDHQSRKDQFLLSRAKMLKIHQLSRSWITENRQKRQFLWKQDIISWAK